MNGREWTQEHTDILWRLAGWRTHEQMAEATGHCVDTVQRRCAMLGIKPFYGHRYGNWQDLPRASLAAIRRAARMAA